MRAFWLAYLATFKDIISHFSIFTTLILSVILYSFFYPTAYKSQQAKALPIIIVDEEQSALTTEIINQVSRSPEIEIQAITPDFNEGKHLIEIQQADGILLLPSNLSQSLHHGENGGIGLYLSATNFLATKQIGVGLSSSIEHSLSIYTERFNEISSFTPAMSIHQIPLFNTLSGYGSYVFPAVAPLIIHQTILLGMSMLLAIYREQQRYLSKTRFIATCLAILTIGCFGCFYLFGFTFWWFDYPRGGNFFGMLLAVPISVFSIVGLTTLFASIIDMPERAGHVIVFTSIPLFMLSGVAWPHAAMPDWMSYLGNLLPSTQIVQMFIQLNQIGVPTSLVIPKLAYLFFIGCISLILGYTRLKKQIRKTPYVLNKH